LIEPPLALEVGDVEQHAAAHHLVLHLGDAVLVGALAVDRLGAVAVEPLNGREIVLRVGLA
jgi:hypothetical protein